MLGAISGVSPYSTYYMNPYRTMNRSITPAQGAASPAEQTQNAQRAQHANSSAKIWTARPSNPEAPVQPVDAVKRVDPDAQKAHAVLSIREGADPAEMAVRMRITPYQDEDAAEDPAELGIFADKEDPAELGIFAGKEDPAELGIFAGKEDPAEVGVLAGEEEPAELGILPGQEEEEANEGVLAKDEDEDNAQGVEDAQEAAEDGKCQTCEKRKYQDGSDDMSVSFQSPTNIKPGQVAAAVRGHEMEHVIHEQAKAKQEGRKVVSQSVTMHTAICPECGTVYISGGETRTVTKANPEQASPEEQEEQKEQEPMRKSFAMFK